MRVGRDDWKEEGEAEEAAEEGFEEEEEDLEAKR